MMRGDEEVRVMRRVRTKAEEESGKGKRISSEEEEEV